MQMIQVTQMEIVDKQFIILIKGKDVYHLPGEKVCLQFINLLHQGPFIGQLISLFYIHFLSRFVTY
jgi:hypothetical protein